MKDKIKEILEQYLDSIISYPFQKKDKEYILDYITNLQEENMKYDQCLTELTDNYKDLQKELTNLQEENKRLRKELELCKKNGEI